MCVRILDIVILMTNWYHATSLYSSAAVPVSRHRPLSLQLA